MSLRTGVQNWPKLLLGLALLMVSSLGLAGSSLLAEGSRATQENGCVAPVPKMRREHMSLLKHDRIETVHKGDRKVTFSLSSCVACHAGKDDKGEPIPVNQPGQFCAGCHQKLAVQLTCFQCHSAVPEGGKAALSKGVTEGLFDAMAEGRFSPEQLQKMLTAHSGIAEK